MKKRDVVTLIVLAIIFSLIFVIVFINEKNNVNIDDETEYKYLTLLKDEITFLSITECINKISQYSNNNSKILSFITKNDINYFEFENTSFKSDKIYVISRGNLYKYYIQGKIYKEEYNAIPEYKKEGYFILNYDKNNNTYNIELIDEKRYKNAKEEKYVFETIKTNEYNNFEKKELTSKNRAFMYFYDFLNKMYYNSDEAYNLLSYNTIIKYFDSYEKFEDFVSNYNNVSVLEFSTEDNKIGIKDNYNNEFIFEISYILDYTVTINKN